MPPYVLLDVTPSSLIWYPSIPFFACIYSPSISGSGLDGTKLVAGGDSDTQQVIDSLANNTQKTHDGLDNFGGMPSILEKSHFEAHDVHSSDTFTSDNQPCLKVMAGLRETVWETTVW